MGTLFNILAYSINSIFSGILIAITGVALMFVIIRSWWQNSIITSISFFVAFTLFCLLGYQSVFLCSAVSFKMHSNDIENTTHELTSKVSSNMQLSSKNAQVILTHISYKFPIVKSYMNRTEPFKVTVINIIFKEYRTNKSTIYTSKHLKFQRRNKYRI